MFFDFHSNSCFVKTQDSKQVVLERSLGGDGLCSFKSIPLSLQSTFQSTKVCPTLPNLPNPARSVHTSVYTSVQTSSKDVIDPILWHSRLGHVKFQTIKTIMKLCDIPITKFNNVNLFCKACCLANLIEFTLLLPLHNTTLPLN